MRFLRALVMHGILIVLVVVLGFLAGVLAAYVWPPRPAQPAAASAGICTLPTRTPS